jgi:hypothetical protein
MPGKDATTFRIKGELVILPNSLREVVDCCSHIPYEEVDGLVEKK